MPRKYKRKEGVRARVVSWTTEQLQSAFHELDKKELGINEISRQFGIPSRTLRRRYAIKNQTKLTLGKHPVLGFEHEKSKFLIRHDHITAGLEARRRIGRIWRVGAPVRFPPIPKY
ncbi:hypothetical protein ACJJTC_016485 [Scirpophaga incertulas]